MHATHPAWRALAAAAALLMAGPSGAATIAATSDFTADGNNVPISATTTFGLPLWTAVDPLNTAQHELLHAIGFTVAYTSYANHVVLDGAGPNRLFKANNDGTGATMANLGPADDGTHVNAGGGTIGLFDQADSIMRPDQVNGQRMGNFEKGLLDAAFNWSAKEIDISVTFAGPGWTPALQAHVNDAVTAAHTLFGSDESGNDFMWTVYVVPEPGSALLGAAGLIFLIRRRRSGRR